MRFRCAAVVSVLILLAGCASHPQMRDLPPGEATWMQGRKTLADGSKLKMIFENDAQTLRISRVDYKVYEGELFLWPIRSPETFEPVAFTLDTTPLKLKEPWTDHVYWVGAVYWDHELGRLVNPDPLGDRVERVRAHITPESANASSN